MTWSSLSLFQKIGAVISIVATVGFVAAVFLWGRV